MTSPEIPLLRESKSFADRLFLAVSRFREPVYFLNRRVNWSYRYCQQFYDVEANCFVENPCLYLAGKCATSPSLSDVYSGRVRGKQFAIVVLKVLSHWCFNVIGQLADPWVKQRKIKKYRKGYVDDIELVFERAETGVVRAVYPFPINLRRQLRYLIFLCRERYFFKLDGNPYGIVDFLKFVAKRDIRSLMALESRAQIRQARAIAKLGITTVQLSDEFDIGSLDFSRCLRQKKIYVINSAHGVGKYFPVHCYQEFHVLTMKQQRYYRSVHNCEYKVRHLNDNLSPDSRRCNRIASAIPGVLHLVLLSQNFGNGEDFIAQSETILIDYLRREFGDCEKVKLFYKPHPNRKHSCALVGFDAVTDIRTLTDCDKTIFVSFFSTCQIDPAFKGQKYLVRGHLIYPEIAFDDIETIKSSADIVSLIRDQLKEIEAQ